MKKSELMSEMFQLTYEEEVGNVISHGVLALLCLFASPYFSIYSYIKGGMLRGIGVGIYMICIFLMLIISTLYHSMDFHSKHKYVFRKLDHMAILFAIAGSYTPIALCLFEGKDRLIVLGIQWIAVLCGVLFKAISKKSLPIISGMIYLSMGWVAIFFLPTLIENSSPQFMNLIVAGGLCYTIGIIFFAQKKKFCHFIWHLFIDSACVLHFIAIVFLM